jgi:hypothetical protein
MRRISAGSRALSQKASQFASAATSRRILHAKMQHNRWGARFLTGQLSGRQDGI